MARLIKTALCDWHHCTSSHHHITTSRHNYSNTSMRITASTHDCMTAFLCIIILLYCIRVSDEVVMPAGEIGPTYICRCKQIKSTRTQVFGQEECNPPTLCSPRPQALKVLSSYIGTPIRKVRPPGRNRCGLDIRIPIVPMIFLSRAGSERATRACGGLEEQLLI